MRKSNITGASFFTAFALALTGAMALSWYEAYALWFGKKPITQRTRLAYHQYPKLFGVSLIGLGMLLGHLFWPPPDEKKDDEAP